MADLKTIGLLGGAGAVSGPEIGGAIAKIVNVEAAINPEIQDAVTTLIQAGTLVGMAAFGIAAAFAYHWLTKIGLDRDGKPDLAPPAA